MPCSSRAAQGGHADSGVRNCRRVGGGGLAAPAGPRDHPGEAVGVVGDGDRVHPNAELLELGDRPVQDDRQRVAVAGAAGDLLERRVAAGRPAGRAARGVLLVAAYGAGEQ